MTSIAMIQITRATVAARIDPAVGKGSMFAGTNEGSTAGKHLHKSMCCDAIYPQKDSSRCGLIWLFT